MGEEPGSFLGAEEEPRPLLEKVANFWKFLFICASYGAAFVSMIQLGFFLAAVPSFGSIIVPTDLQTWMEERWKHGVGFWEDFSTSALLFDVGLLFLFWAQHSGLSSRNLEGTWLWMQLHFVYRIDRPLYILGTAASVQAVLWWWRRVPVVLWQAAFLSDYYVIVHLFAWMALYGTSLMLDLPDMVGFNQVVINSPTVTQKSPDLQLMFRVQRHLGFLPFLLLFFVHPLMTLDRFLMGVATLTYTYASWRSTLGCYEYANRMKGLKKRRL